MNGLFGLLLAENLSRTTFEWGRIQSNSDWIIPVAVLVMAAFFVRQMYRRDGRELGRSTRIILTVLRTCVFVALLVLYLQPQWRVETERQVNSRVVLLADTSLSMGMADAGDDKQRLSRAKHVAETLRGSGFVEQITSRHDLAVFRFDERLESMAELKKQAAGDAAADKKSAKHNIDWDSLLEPRGAETRIGDALREVIEEQRDAPISAIICISDGCQNRGAAARAAIAAAQEAKIPVHMIGVGSDSSPVNARVSDFVVPPRAYPGDEYTVTGYVQGHHLEGKRVNVELLRRPAGDENSQTKDAARGTGEVVERREVSLGEDGQIVPVKFQLTPQAVGRETLCFKISGIENDFDTNDNLREADVDVVDRKCHVLLVAGGPSREYRFLRNMLYRDSSVRVDVLLQTSRPGISQDADTVLDDFPATREEMFKYDCVVALDPDWRAFSDGQLKLLENWVARQGGGLLVAAGAVHMGNPIDSWVSEERMDIVRDLYPVTFHRRFSVSARSHAAEDPWPLDFTRDGLEAEFLWLGDDSAESQNAWSKFSGVYGFYPVQGAKPGATVYARFSDPAVASSVGGRDESAYFAGQFYGSGRVFYMGSSEMWRLRRLDEAFFEQFHIKLIRHLSQGRLLQGSSRGSLQVGRERYMLGNTAEVRARLTDAQLEPLEAAHVSLDVILPDGSKQNVSLKPEVRQKGTFAGRVPLVQEGVYRLELTVPQSDDVRLTRRIQVKMPDLERQNTQRNDALLSGIAKLTGGRYYADPASAMKNMPAARSVAAAAYSNGQGGSANVAAAGTLLDELKDRTKTVVLVSAPNRIWRKYWLAAAMLLICGLLCTEWLIRRLVKLA